MQQSPAGTYAIDAWRASLLRRLIRFTLIVLLLSFGAFWVQSGGDDRAPMVIIGAAIGGVGTSLWLARSHRTLAASLFALTMLVGSAGAVLENGLALPNPFIGAFTVLTILSLALGRRFAWLCLGAFGVGLLAMGWVFTTNGAPPPHPRHDASILSNWLRATVIFSAAAAITIAAVSYLTSKLESALLKSEELIGILKAESSEKLESVARENQLQLQLRKTQQLEALGQLASGIAHDFNNLLVVIINNARFAQQDWLQETGKPNEELADLEQAGEHAAALTQQLLAFSGKAMHERGAFDVNEAVHHSLKLLKRLLPANIALNIALTPDKTPMVGARSDIEQIVFNLCLNARDAMPDGGSLSVSTHWVNRHEPTATTRKQLICLSVRDSGEGMTEETRARVFEPFFSTKEEGKGTGLGLSVVERAAEEHEGFVEVESRPGEGSEFRVYLPTRQTSNDATAPAEESDLAPLGGTETLLLVDDNANVRKILATLLEKAGYHIEQADSGAEALVLFRQRPKAIDLIITDAIMPLMGGRELYEEVCLDYPLLPFLFCSGYASGTLPPEFFDAPQRAFLAKPFEPEEVLRRVRQLLDARGKNNLH